VIHALAVRADVSTNSAFRRASWVKEHGVRIEKANTMSTKSWGEEGMAEMPNIDMCLTSKICE
jgi:hypothetical protein